jgi:hypothetical protein
VLPRRVKVPCGACAGLKGDVGTGVVGGVVAGKEHVDLDVAGEIRFRPLERLLRARWVEGLRRRRSLFAAGGARFVDVNVDSRAREALERFCLYLAYSYWILTEWDEARQSAQAVSLFAR